MRFIEEEYIPFMVSHALKKLDLKSLSDEDFVDMFIAFYKQVRKKEKELEIKTCKN